MPNREDANTRKETTTTREKQKESLCYPIHSKPSQNPSKKTPTPSSYWKRDTNTSIGAQIFPESQKFEDLIAEMTKPDGETVTNPLQPPYDNSTQADQDEPMATAILTDKDTTADASMDTALVGTHYITITAVDEPISAPVKNHSQMWTHQKQFLLHEFF